MKIVEITFKTEIPVDATDTEIREWAEYNLGYTGGCSLKNPLVDYDFEASSVEIQDA